MNGPGGWGKEPARPYFFLSYAHAPRPANRGPDPNHWVAKLYDDLIEAITMITDVPEGAPVGFMDQSMHQGQFWAERLAKELATCRVFVPLYSPRYFKSHACGQEWHAFTQRPVYQRRQDVEETSGIVPALWIATKHYTLPRCASDLQFNHASFGPDYAAEGLYALMKLSDYRAQYERAVHRLAERIVEVAEQTVVPVGRPLDFEGLPSAFGTPEPTGALHISVFSCRRGELPPGRSADYYGVLRTDWQPYRPESRRPLAEDAAEVARNMGFRPTVHEFDTESTALLGSADPAAPGVLLVDRWALGDSRRRENLRRVDRRNPAWLSTLEPWNTADEECAAHDGELGRISEDVLRNAHGTLRPSLRGGTTATPATLEEFRGAMERAVIRANDGFERRNEPKAAVPEARRPTLRADFDTGQRPRLAPLYTSGDDEDGGGTGRATPGGGQP
ncbi:TIR-like protein FxsC [Kitasatospora sp. NPDC059571]|uniref:TIR-like protein FxsC n=1 Tax=Kitasatospora sp. NPDC059571 TaxID=3346871 RepID=UPI0036B32BE5